MDTIKAIEERRQNKILPKEMNFILEHEDLSNYVLADKYVDFDKKIIQDKAKELFSDNLDEIQKIKKVNVRRFCDERERHGAFGR